ncbi:hypothetical protein LIER_24847 [Lithospermum erythrorhizon]|uniref:Uncharacterized protein n=1 Tax=Lithospermum erythrorhizon TaxID=34254 RepID=A0AAV3R2P0_LITER
MDFQASTKSIFMENPVNWPVKVIAANSIYRVSQSLLLRYGNRYSNLKLDDIIFKKIVAMIADIFTVCLTNILDLITKKCYSSAIETRQSSVKEAAQLFGATEEILKLLEQQVQLPTIAPADGAPYIDEWRVLVKNQIVMASDPTHNDETEVTARSSDERLLSMEP